MIHVRNETRLRIARARIAAAAQAALEAERCGHLDVSVTVVGAERIHALNRDHLGHDYPTDVISFTLREEGDPDPLLGEVVVSSDRAREEARARGIGADEELLRYVVHGVLHLLGWEDDTPGKRRRMHARQERVLAGVMAGAGRAGGRRGGGGRSGVQVQVQGEGKGRGKGGGKGRGKGGGKGRGKGGGRGRGKGRGRGQGKAQVQGEGARGRGERGRVGAAEELEPLIDMHATYRDMWEALTPAERMRRSWAMRSRLPDPRAVHDEKLFPRP
jgi:probable rRNA maturation factor